MNKKSIKLKVHTGMAGYYRVIKHKANPDGSMGEKIFETPWRPNLILNTGLNRMGTYTLTGKPAFSSLITRLFVGTGSTEPAVTDTNLGAVAASTSGYSANTIDDNFVNVSPIYRRWRKQIIIGTGTGNLNLTEFAGGWSSIPLNNLFFRQLFRDEFGVPITITKLDLEFLTIQHELRVYPHSEMGVNLGTIKFDTLDINVQFIISWPDFGETSGTAGTSLMPRSSINSGDGSSIDFTTISVQDYSFSLGDVGTALSLSNNAYISGSFKRTATAVMDFGHSNFEGGIPIIAVRDGMLFSGTRGNSSTGSHSALFKFNPPIPKAAIHRVTFTFEGSWGRYTPPE